MYLVDDAQHWAEQAISSGGIRCGGVLMLQFTHCYEYVPLDRLEYISGLAFPPV